MKLYGFLPLAAQRESTPGNPMMFSFNLHKSTSRADRVIATMRAAGVPIIFHSPFGLMQRKPQTLESAAFVGDKYPWIEPWVRSVLEPGDIVYVGSIGSHYMNELLRIGATGMWLETTAKSVAPVLDAPGVSLCVDAGFPALRDAGPNRELVRRTFAQWDEALRRGGGRLYLEPRPAVEWPELDHYGWLSTDEHWEGAHDTVINPEPRGPGVVMFHSAGEIKFKKGIIRDAAKAGHDIALNYTAFNKKNAEEWKQQIMGVG